MYYLVLWCSGYHICFTRRRSPVRSWSGSIFADSFMPPPTAEAVVRMAEWSKAPDSRFLHTLSSGRGLCAEHSGPLLRAWVRIPLLTRFKFFRLDLPTTCLFYLLSMCVPDAVLHGHLTTFAACVSVRGYSSVVEQSTADR